MPELPEIETYIRDLEPLLKGKQITGASVYWPRIVAAPNKETFVEAVTGERFQSFGRRGKYMLFGMASGRTLIVHLRMTGELRLRATPIEADKHTHALFDLDTGERLLYRDQRKFGRIWFIEDPEEILYKLGPEPLDEGFGVTGFANTLSGRTAAIKSLLLNQSILAGVGNIYADEALFRAGIDPRREGGSLNRAEIESLHSAIRAVLQRGIDLRGSTLGSGPQNYAPPNGIPGGAQNAHQVFRRTDEPCPDCATPIRRVVVSQRSTHFCPACQT